MAMQRRWVAECDADGCAVSVVLDVIPDGKRWDYGMQLNDLDWQAGPGTKKTYCPDHHVADFGVASDAERERWTRAGGEALRLAFEETSRRRRP